MVQLQAYKIGRKGPKHFRMEVADAQGNPTGEPYRGPLMRRDAVGRDTPTGRYALAGYRSQAGDGFKDVIRCTPDQAAALRHMQLTPLVGVTPTAAPAEGAHDSTSAPHKDSDIDVPGDPKVNVPEDWHTMSAKDRKALAALILGDVDAAEGMRAKEADEIIEEYLSKE